MAEIEMVRIRGFKLELRDSVYRPADDSLLMLDAILSLGRLEGLNCLDVGTGSGILALAMAKLGCFTVATDISPDAVSLTSRNLALNGLYGEVIQADLTRPFRDDSFDLIVSNPPYLPVDDGDGLGRAWSGGRRGREIIDRLLTDLRRVLKSEGRALILHADFNDPQLSIDIGMKLGFDVRLVGRRKVAFHELLVLEFRSASATRP